jgi:alkylation response protein AidB-like acyl-CoA dehydrogenase
MFNLDTSEETRAVAELGRSLGLDVLFPLVKSAEEAGDVPQAARQALFDSGLTISVAEEWGGGGIPTCVASMAAVEALSYGDAGLTLASAFTGAAALLIGRLGSVEQQADLLPRFATDPDAIAAVALYEGHGRSPNEYETRLVARSVDGFRLIGAKVAVAHADRADPLLVVAQHPSGGVCVVLVRTDQPGVQISMPTRGMALDAARLCAVTFNCEISEEAIIANASMTSNATDLAIAHVRLAVAAAMLGVAQRAIDYAAKYANERVAFGKPISSFQGVSFMLADAAIRVGAARVEMLEVAERIDSNDADDIERRTTEAVNYTGAVSAQATRDAMQVLGGHGFITDHPVEIWYRTTAALATLDFDPLCSVFEPAL